MMELSKMISNLKQSDDYDSYVLMKNALYAVARYRALNKYKQQSCEDFYKNIDQGLIEKMTNEQFLRIISDEEIPINLSNKIKETL